MYSIQATVNMVNFNKISHAKNSKEAYDILIKYDKDGVSVKNVKLQSMIKKHELHQMGKNETFVGYTSKIQDQMHTMKSNG